MTASIEIRTAPHIKGQRTVERIMRQVVMSLAPICGFFVYQYGLSAAASLLVVTLACLGTERIFARTGSQSGDISDWSATITGILLALSLPPGFPLWMGAVAGFVAIALGKALFGGIGFNVFNPALVGRAFVQAAAYAKARERKDGPPQRRDLRLEALAEILAHQRMVHIHSYRQDEILMFARLSHALGFEVAAFQHVLEGYKVADVLAEVHAGASTFADWWGFKMETIDAIPYNAGILTAEGVITSLNSDSNDLGRRLNTEAGKMVKYSGLSETQALALVTLNPAKQLRVDDRVGSIVVGKDADLVLWSAAPLSS